MCVYIHDPECNWMQCFHDYYCTIEAQYMNNSNTNYITYDRTSFLVIKIKLLKSYYYTTLIGT